MGPSLRSLLVNRSFTPLRDSQTSLGVAQHAAAPENKTVGSEIAEDLVALGKCTQLRVLVVARRQRYRLSLGKDDLFTATTAIAENALAAEGSRLSA